MEDFEFKSVNNCTLASGENWKYERVGRLCAFKQTGKVPSLRVIKTLIKLLEKGNK